MKRYFQRLAFRRREFFLLGLACLSLFSMLFERIQKHREISQSRQRVARTVTALQNAENVTTLVLRAETAQRGFLLTGSAEYLEPYSSTVQEIPAAMEDFSRAAEAIHLNSSKVQSLKKLTSAKLREVAQVLKLYHREGSETALALVRTDEGLRLMDEIWRLSGELKRESVQLFTRDSEMLAWQNQNGFWTSISGIAVVLFVVILATVRLARSFHQNTSLVQQYADSVERYQMLARKLVSVREDERAHLAREIHDALGQTLTVIKLDVAIAERQMASADMESASNKLGHVTHYVDTAIRELRKVAKELRPPLLDAAGLVPALQAYVTELQERTGLRINFSAPDPFPWLSPEQAITGFRICQEALTNVIRHAKATQVSVRAWAESEQVSIQVEDNGQGFVLAEAGKKQSLGLLGMQERAGLVSGTLSIESSSGAGTEITLHVPIYARAT